MANGKSAKRQRQKEQKQAKIEEQNRIIAARRRRVVTINLTLLAVVVGAIGFLLFNQNAKKKPGSATETAAALNERCKGTPDAGVSDKVAPPGKLRIDLGKTYKAIVETNKGTMTFTLDAKTSPCTVNSFVYLAKKKFFDGTIFHRLVKGFALQGGDPLGTGSGGPGYKVVDKPPAGFKYVKGVVAMAKSGAEPDGTSGSQFFIVPGDGASTLPAQYAVLGRVTGGLDVVAVIDDLLTEDNGQGEKSKPLGEVRIIRVTIKES